MELTEYPFHILIKPIGPLCNLNCRYCFYLKKKTTYPENHPFRMSKETLRDLTKQYIEAQPPGTKEINFGWQGGEPTLMGLDFFRLALKYQQEYARPGLKITNALQTNATLLDDSWGKFLKKHDFLVGVSVDGPMKIHDKFRKSKKNAGSFEQVRKGIEILQRYQVEHNFLCVINSHNGNHPQKVYKALKKLGAIHIQFIPIVEHNYFEGQAGIRGRNGVASEQVIVSGLSVAPDQFGKFLNRVFDEWQENDVGKIFVQNFENVVARLMGSPPTMCVHAIKCGRNLVVEHDGTLFSCDHFVYPEFKLGNIINTSLSDMVDGTKQIDFGNTKTDKLCSDCKKCSFLQLCHGGCPSHRISSIHGEMENRNYLCKGYIKFYQHSIGRLTEIAQIMLK